MPFVVGENIGPYRILEQLGHGGMATVFKAYHAALDRYVAIKALHPAFTVEQNFLERFQREARVVAKLEHPNIVPVYDFSEHEGRPYLVMKFIEGETLKARLSRGPLDKAELNKIVESVGAALAYAHQQGVLHRDIKPSNVLLTNDGRVYLADFGLARMAAAGESTISSDVLLGTPQYISPEQALGKRDLDNGTDIYSFGVLLYELLVGRVPYNADTPYSVIHDHIYTPLPMPRSIRLEITEAAERMLLKAMAKERGDRFPDIESLLAAWRQAQSGQPEENLPVQVAVPAKVVVSQQGSGEILPPEAVPQSTESVAPQVKTPPASTVVLEEVHSAAAQAQSASIAPEPAANKKAVPRWLWIVAIPLLLCLCLAALLLGAPNLRSRLFSALGFGAAPVATLVDTPVSAATQLPLAGNTAQTPPQKTGKPLISTLTVRPTKDPPQLALPRPLQTQEVATPISLDEAQERVEEEPDNPLAHVELAIALLDAGENDQGRAELDAARRLAGNDGRFYSSAGRMLAQQRYMLYAAEDFSTAVNLSPAPAEELIIALKQTMYMAASDQEFGDFLEKADLARLEPEFVEIVRGRYLLLVKEDVTGAAKIARQFTTGEIKFYEVKLLEAEIIWNQGNKIEARNKLKVLSQDQAAPQWVRTLAEMIIHENFR